MTRAASLFAAGLSCLALVATSGCNPDADTPVGVVRLFLRAASSGDTRRLYQLLAPASCKRLQKLAKLATAQVGSGRTIPPDELLAASIGTPRFELSSVQLLRREGEHARVKLISQRRHVYEVIDVVLEKPGWRVILPDRPRVFPLRDS